MSTRFFTNAAIALLAGVVVVLSVGMRSTVGAAWVAFAIGIGVVAISALAQLDTRRGVTQRLLDTAMVATGGTLIGASIVYGGSVVKWLVFALALGLAGLAFAGMGLHEIENWRGTRDLGQLHWLAPEFAPARHDKGRREETALRG